MFKDSNHTKTVEGKQVDMNTKHYLSGIYFTDRDWCCVQSYSR